MVLKKQQVDQILEVFKFVRTHKEEASSHNSLANSALKDLSKVLEIDKSVITDTYKKWDDSQGDEKLGAIVSLYEALKG